MTESEHGLAIKLDQIHELLQILIQQKTIREWYTTAEVAEMLQKAEFTVREWCRQGRIHAEKRQSGRGPHSAWVVSHDEILRYQREGLLPLSDT